VQFKTLFTDGLYDKLAIHSISMAKRLADGIRSLGYDFLFPVETNLIIPIFPAKIADKLNQLYGFYIWQDLGDKKAARLLTSWATSEDKIDEFLEDLRNGSKPPSP